MAHPFPSHSESPEHTWLIVWLSGDVSTSGLLGVKGSGKEPEYSPTAQVSSLGAGIPLMVGWETQKSRVDAKKLLMEESPSWQAEETPPYTQTDYT